MAVDRPMFILGPPRCGTTLLYYCIGSHPDVGYFNRANRKYLGSPRLAWFLTRLGFMGDHARESRKIWDRFHRGSDAVMTAGDARSEVKKYYHDLIERVLRARGAVRFVAKLPSHSVRVPWLDAVFPDAIFVQALRDWRAVVASTVVKRAKDFNGEWFGVKARGWEEAARLPPEMGAAWQYRVTHEILEEQAELYPGRYVRVWYEDLCLEPVKVMQKAADSCGLRWTPEIENALPKNVHPPSDKWKQTLTPEMIERIMAEHGEVLSRYAYPPAGITV